MSAATSSTRLCASARRLVAPSPATPSPWRERRIPPYYESIAGFKSGRTLERPEETLGSYDIVFAKARAALEAAAVGAAVVLCDVAGAGPMVTTDNVAVLRRQNFGMRALRETASVDWMVREISRYDADDAAAVSRHVRDHGGHEAQIDQLLAIYADVIAESAGIGSTADAEQRAAAVYLRGLSSKLHERDLLKNAFAQLLRVPVAGAWLRHRARREHWSHWFRELLRAIDAG